MTCIETYATLRIFSKDISPDIIGTRLGIEATEVIPIDPASQYKTRRENHFWNWTTKKTIGSTDNLEHINAILQLLEGKEKLLTELRQDGCDTDIFCFWLSSGQGGPYLDLNTMETLLKFGLEISWDFYFDDEDEKYKKGSGQRNNLKL